MLVPLGSRYRLLRKVLCEPIQAFVQTSSVCGAAGLDKPFAVGHAGETKLLSEVCDLHGVGEILLVSEYQNSGVSELLLRQHLLQLITSLGDTVTIVTIDNINETLCILEVMPPERADLILTSDIPHSELNVLVVNGPAKYVENKSYG